MSQFIEVIEHLDPTGDTIVQRFPADGSGEIKMGAQLVVRENQAAVFYRDGRALDTFGPGRHTLSSANIPLVTKALSLPFGFDSPFRAEVVFVNLKTFANQKWGTSEPIAYRDTELASDQAYCYRVRAVNGAGASPDSTTSCAVTTALDDPTLFAAYDFDEGSGSNAEDDTGHGNSGTLANGADWSANGRFGGAISLNGVAARVSLGGLDIIGSATQ